jgi:nicotinamidase-related amidase
MDRLANMINRVGNKLNDIHVTLDSHHFFDIAHPIFFKNSSGQNPPPFTIISDTDVENGVWMPTIPSRTKATIAYLKALKAANRYPHCIWPPHCLIGSEGASIYPEVFQALVKWEQENVAMVDMVTKGSNYMTEHFSAVKAEVPDPQDPSTQVNTDLIKTLLDADMIAIAGEAGSHCLANTVRDIATEFGSVDYVKKMVLLEDATSPVPGFENFQTDFINEMVKKGMQISNTVDFLK